MRASLDVLSSTILGHAADLDHKGDVNIGRVPDNHVASDRKIDDSGTLASHSDGARPHIDHLEASFEDGGLHQTANTLPSLRSDEQIILAATESRGSASSESSKVQVQHDCMFPVCLSIQLLLVHCIWQLV
jgi:hypothetical protein